MVKNDRDIQSVTVILCKPHSIKIKYINSNGNNEVNKASARNMKKILELRQTTSSQ